MSMDTNGSPTSVGVERRVARLHRALLRGVVGAGTAADVADAVVDALRDVGACRAAEVTWGADEDGQPRLVLASAGRGGPTDAWTSLPAGPEHHLLVAGPMVPGAALVDAAEALAAALAHAEHVDRLRRDAATDPLTGLANRRAMDRQLDADLARAARGGPVVALLLVDVDDLKVVNDVAGHPAGDRVLQRLAEVLRSNARGGDLVARIGGDEFALVLPGTGLHGAVALARRIHGRLARAGTEPPLRASIGLATTEHVEPVPARLLEAADRSLYRAKADGKRAADGQQRVPPGVAHHAAAPAGQR